MQVAVEPFNFLLLPANIQYFSVLINGQFSKGCRFDALRDLLCLKDQYPVTAHAPNFDFLTGCREFQRCEK